MHLAKIMVSNSSALVWTAMVSIMGCSGADSLPSSVADAADASSSDAPTMPPTSSPAPSPSSPGTNPAPTPTPAPTTPPPPVSKFSAGCGHTPTITGNAKNQTITVGNASRSYQMIVPPNYNSADPIPLIFGFHYVGGTSANVEGENVHLAPTGEKALYIFPQGLKLGANTGWNEKCGGNDMNLVDALITYAETNYCIDTDRLFAFGFSWGGDMTNAVGCCLGSKFRAVAPMSGGDMGSGTTACTKPTPAYMLQYGTADQAYSQSGFANVIANYRHLQNCSEQFTQLDTNCRSYNGCTQEVRACSFPGLTHDLAPGFAARLWGFFSKYK